jgi:hypothetical protein
MPPRPLLLLVLIAALATAACDGGAADSTTTTSSTTTTIGVTVRTSGERSVTVGEDVDGGLAEQLETQLVDLAATTEVLRGLSFLSPPKLSLLGQTAFPERWETFFDARLDPVALAIDTRLYRTLGLLTAAQDLRALLRSIEAGPVPAFYDGATGEVVVAATQAELEPFAASVVVRALTEALTDQYHRTTTTRAELRTSGRYDEAQALDTLAFADALTTQLRYLEGLPDSTRVVAAGEAAAYAMPQAPPFLTAELSFATDDGLAFVVALIDEGGMAAVDAAYEATLTTELVAHPVRYLAGEGVLSIEPPTVDVPGFSVDDAGSLGELGLRSLLTEAVSPGVLTQTVDGWGADAFVTLTDASDIAFVYLFRGDTVADTVEVAQAFLDHAARVMGLAEPIAAGGGVELAGPAPVEGEEEGDATAAPDGPYVFVDRSGDGLVVVISSDATTGRALVRQVEIP